jgi:hypothetical protein
MKTKISLKTCKKRLAILWFTVGLILFVVLSIQTALGTKFADKEGEAWGWFLPTMWPTLSLIIGVLLLDATFPTGTDKQIERFFFWLTFGLSAFYLTLVALTILMQPFTGLTLLELMKRSNLWLGPIQGLVAAALGAFFVKGERVK